MTRWLYRASGARAAAGTVALAVVVILTEREAQRRAAADIWEAFASGVDVGEWRARGLLGDTQRDRRLRAVTAGI
jgi:hypothetical protein